MIFRDLRTGKISCKYTESHMEDVTQVRFHPNGALFSGSMDGLICVFDITKSNEDDAVQNGTFHPLLALLAAY
jgi:WD40 repeat protein